MANDRVRKIDVSKLPAEQIEDLSKQLGGKVESRLNNVKNELDQILKIYGLKIDIGFQISPLGNG